MATETQAAPARKARGGWWKTVLPPVLVFVAMLILWQAQAIHALLNIQTFQLPLPSQIAQSFTERSRDLWIGTWYTLGEAVAFDEGLLGVLPGDDRVLLAAGAVAVGGVDALELAVRVFGVPGLAPGLVHGRVEGG